MLAIVGPTGSGKTALAMAVAERVGGEILSCDSVQVYQGFDIGSGFASTKMTGSEHNDAFIIDKSGDITTASNYSGGIQGGIANGADITFRVAFTPTATISTSQRTVNSSGEEIELKAKGRHDPCVGIRAVPVGIAMTNFVIADLLLIHKSKSL